MMTKHRVLSPRNLVAALGAAACLSMPASAQTPRSYTLDDLMQFRGRVLVGDDGNGVLSAAFPTKLEGEGLRYTLVLENGCREPVEPPPEPVRTDEAPPCPAPTNGIEVTLNGEVVLQTTDRYHAERVQVALNPVGGEQNRIVAAAVGEPGTGARIAIIAHPPLPGRVGGRSVLPWAWTAPQTRAFLLAHNAGPSPLFFRVIFFHRDGTLAGRTLPRRLPVHATATLDLAFIARELQLDWRAGPVHIVWAAPAFTRLSAVASETHREPGPDGTLRVVNARELALDDYGPHRLSRAEYEDVAGPQRP
jgi:hypothetical protein